MRTNLCSAVACIALLSGACANPPPPAAQPPDSVVKPVAAPDPEQKPEQSYPTPRDGVVPQLGDAAHLDIGAWNLRFFPSTPRSAEAVADLVYSMDLDLLAVEEISDDAAFEELVARLPEHEGILSTHTYGDGTYQKVGFVFRSSLITVVDQREIFQSQGWDFPRPPLQATLVVNDGRHEPRTLIAIAVHLKAGREDADFERRGKSIVLLDQQVQKLLSDGESDEVIVLGDFNEDVDKAPGRANFAPFLDEARYTLETLPLVDTARSFLKSHVVLDHMVTTKALGDRVPANSAEIPELDDLFDGYREDVSDHLPVVLHVPL